MSNSSGHSHRKWKDSLETRAVPLIFSQELEISKVAVQIIHQNSEKWWLLGGIAQWKWLWGCFSQFLLLWPWCRDFWGSSEDRYRSKKVLQMLLKCYNLLNSQNISINKQQWKMVGYKDTSDLPKKAAEVAQKKEQ